MSLSTMILLSSCRIVAETYTEHKCLGTFFADQRIAFVFGIVEVLEFAFGVHFEVEVLMTIGALMANIVTDEEIL